MAKIGDIYWALRAIGGPQLRSDVEKEGAKAGDTFGKSLLSNIRKSWSGAEIGKGLVQGLGLAGGLGAARLLSEGIGAVSDAISGTIQSAIGFERAMQNVNSITKTSNDQLAAMGKGVLKLAGDFGQSATTLADGLYNISSSGFQGADAMKVLEAATKAATAGLATTDQAASGLTAVLNAYGKSADEAGQVSDVLFQTVNRGVITFPELSDQIGKTTALAAPLGVSLEEVAAATALMTRNGVGAEETFTQINAVMNSMLMPSKQAAELAAELGLQWDAAALRANGLAGQMSLLVEKTGGSEEKMALLLGDTRAVRGAFVLAKNAGKDLNAELKIMQSSAGATASAFEEQSKSTAFHLAQMQAKIEAAQIEIGEKLLPIVADLADAVTKNLVPALEDFATALGRTEDAAAHNEEPLQNLVNIIHDLFKAPEEDPRTFLGSLFDGLNDVQSNLSDTAAAINDWWTFWDDHSTLADRRAARTAEAFSKMSEGVQGSVENMRGRVGDDLAQSQADLASTSGAMDSTGSHATGMANTVDAAGDKVKTTFEDVRKSAVTELGAMIDGYFNPIETRYDLDALRAESAEARKQRAHAKTKKAVHDANESIIRNLDAQAQKLEDLAATGDITQADINAFTDQAKKDYASMGKKVPPELQKVIAKLNAIVKFNGRDVDIDILIQATRDFSKGVSMHLGRAAGGPVEAGRAYIVGEKRAELFVPNQDGHIVPRVPATTPIGASTMTQTFNVTVAPGSDVSTLAARRFGQAVLDEIASGLREQTARTA